ncbi:hypothetical protein D3C80_1831440 [compost metagenome]
MVKPVTISFKNTKEDEELYLWIISHSDKSAFVKDTLRKIKNGDISNISHPQKTINENNDNLIDLDF